MKNTLNIGVLLAGMAGAVLLNPTAKAQEAPSYAPESGYSYSTPDVGIQGQYPAYADPLQQQYPGYGATQQGQYPGYGGEQFSAYGAGQSQPYPDYGYEYPAYGYAQAGQYPAPGSDQSAYTSDPYAYTQPDFGYQAPAYGYPQPGYDYGYGDPAYGYAQPGYDYGYGDPAYGYAQQPYVDPAYGVDPSTYYGFTQQPGSANPPTMSYPGYGGFPGNVPWENLNTPDIFGEKSPFQDPLQHEGSWTKEGFRPWRTGPFAYDKWEDHPATKMPWGNFPGWGKGFFGGFGPDSWEGVTPWGNDVPFKWIDPTDPEESFAQMWEDGLNTPNRMGRLPPGFTAPYISVPNPIDVENEFERNAKNAPDEIHKMWGNGEGGSFGGDSNNDKGDAGKDGQGRDAQAGNPKDKEGKSGGEKQNDKQQARDNGWGWDNDWWNDNKRSR